MIVFLLQSKSTLTVLDVDSILGVVLVTMHFVILYALILQKWVHTVTLLNRICSIGFTTVFLSSKKSGSIIVRVNMVFFSLWNDPVSYFMINSYLTVKIFIAYTAWLLFLMVIVY